MLTPGNGNGAQRWSPAPYVPPALPYQAVRPSLGDTAAPISAAESFWRSPVIAFGTSFIAAVAGGYLAYGLGRQRNVCLRWNTSPKNEVVGHKRNDEGRLVDVYGGGLSLSEAMAKCPGTTWVTFWWVLAAAMGVKALHDLSEMNA